MVLRQSGKSYNDDDAGKTAQLLFPAMPGSDRDFAKNLWAAQGENKQHPLSVILSQQFLLRRIQKTIMQPSQIVIRIHA